VSVGRMSVSEGDCKEELLLVVLLLLLAAATAVEDIVMVPYSMYLCGINILLNFLILFQCSSCLLPLA